MTCQELKASRPMKHDFGRYDVLHPEGRRLISGWFERAWQARECKDEDSFEPFIFTWFAVNGWAACVTGVDQDQKYLKALMSDQTMCQDFARLFSDSGAPFRSYAADFAWLWPIFEVKDLRQRRINGIQSGGRDTIVRSYLAEGAGKYQPQCWKRHRDAGEQVPLDWPHTLAAIYRVRCNLFHGEKAAHSEMD